MKTGAFGLEWFGVLKLQPRATADVQARLQAADAVELRAVQGNPSWRVPLLGPGGGGDPWTVSLLARIAVD